jgi:hypothetical protein
VIYTEATKADYVSPPCPLCGAAGEVEWVDVREITDPPDAVRVVPGMSTCVDRCSEWLTPQERYDYGLKYLAWHI